MTGMYISQIILRDWKAYTAASFDFPAPGPERNMVLIGAPNGYGKTSLFEAIVLGMFGRDGLALIARSPFSGNDEDRLATSYKNFLEKALHRGAVDAGRHSCSVKLAFADGDDEPLEIQRTWHFNNSGVYRPHDEEIHVFEGLTRRAVGPPAGSQGRERLDWYRDYIARTFLPYYLAAFFLFDGEQVSAFAERDMAGQVRTGIEGLLGIPVLRSLAEDLRKFATARMNVIPNVSDKTIEIREQERERLSDELKQQRSRLEGIAPGIARLKDEREKLTRELASYGSASQANFQEQVEQLARCRGAVNDDRGRLEDMLAKDIALALSGEGLRGSVKCRLESETVRERWENGRRQGDNNLERFLDAVDVGLHEIRPQIAEHQRTSILETARNAWEQLWSPPPENCAEAYLHPYLNEMDRSKVIEQLEELGQLGAHVIVEILDSIAAHEAEVERLESDIVRMEDVAPHVDEKRKQLTVLNDQIEKQDRDAGSLEREIGVLESQISQKNKELTKLSGQQDQAKPSVRRATRARKVADMVDMIVTRAVPSQIDAIAQAMTDAHCSMAHKKDMVERIEIDEDCEVKLLNGDGTDVRRYDLSAGEKQIFTQALISAVSSVSGRGFPMVVDTPLGRLDIEHRKGVLKHLVKRGQQVILLSTNTEVVGEYLQEIAPHVQRKYLIQFERVGEIGRSSVRRGYFDDIEDLA